MSETGMENALGLAVSNAARNLMNVDDYGERLDDRRPRQDTEQGRHEVFMIHAFCRLWTK